MRGCFLIPLLVLAAGCAEFWGEEEMLGFESSLCFDSLSRCWNPKVPVAEGTTFSISAITHADAQEFGNPNATANVVDPAVLVTLDDDVNYLLLEAEVEGTSTIEWEGVFDDHFDVEVAAPVEMSFADPVLEMIAAAEEAESINYLHGFVPAAPESQIKVINDAQLALWLDLLDSQGRYLGYDPNDLELWGLDINNVEGVLFVRAFEEGEFEGAHLGVDLGALEIETTDSTEVTALELLAVDPLELRDVGCFDLLVLVTAFDASGQRLFQPEVDWTFPDGFVEVSQDIMQVKRRYYRTDLLLLDWVEGPGAVDVTISATSNSIPTQASFTWNAPSETCPVDDTPLGDTPLGDLEDNYELKGGCGCQSSGGPAGILIVLLGGALVFGRRRLEQSRQSPTKNGILSSHIVEGIKSAFYVGL
ncbi:MAG: hypothetical protein HN348_14400 [Proteobacteria bacterium]|jgi:uncharacterized protein (TIGR03382 family)|nr:hypothetical protein [Pseudomonadota bacterium]